MSWQTTVKENKLDISVVKLSDCLKENRLDSEFYIPEFLYNDQKLQQKSYFVLDEYLMDIRYGLNIDPLYTEEGTKFLRALNLKEYGLEGEILRIPISAEKVGKNNLLQKGDLLIVRSGANVGDMGVVLNKDFEEATFGSYVIKIQVKNINSYYLYVFLKSKYGRYQTVRYRSGTAQPNISIPSLKNLKIVKPNNHLEKEIEKLLFLSDKKKIDAGQVYFEAERLLLKEINLEEYKASDKNISVRNFKECLINNRFDAEYWQPDFDVVIDKILQYKKGVSTIGDEFKQLKGNFKAEKNVEYNYIEIGDVNVSTGEVDHTSIIGAELPANAKIKFGKKQLITSKVRPNRGASAILDNHEGSIGSGAFTVLVEKGSINLETLMIYLKTKPIRELLLRYNTGTSYPVITDSDVLKLPIPLIDKQFQKKIGELVNMSTRERQEAKILFEKAKRAVEIFVEQDEKSALEFLK